MCSLVYWLLVWFGQQEALEIRWWKRKEIRYLFPAPSKQRCQESAESLCQRSTPVSNHAFPFQPGCGKSTPWGPASALLFSLIPVPIFVNACFLLNSPQITHSKCFIFFLTNTQVNQKSYTKSSMGSDKRPRRLGKPGEKGAEVSGFISYGSVLFSSAL